MQIPLKYKTTLEFKRLVVEVTQNCNHKCIHCYNYWRDGSQPAKKQAELSRRQIRDLIRKIKGEIPLQQVALSGGEPLLRKDLAGIVCDMADEGLDCVVISNGTLLSDSRLREFPEGTVFEVTLFSTDGELHNRIARREAYEKVLNSLVRIKKHRCRFAIALVVSRLNADKTLQAIELGAALGAEGFLFNRVNLNRNIFSKAGELVPGRELLARSLDEAEEASEKYGVSIAVSVPVPACVIDPGKYSRLYFGWCPRGNKESYYTVDSSGFLRPCNHSSIILGSLLKDSFRDLVQSKTAAKFWSTVPSQCLACTHPLKEKCLGGCPAAAYECYGSNEYIDPFVDASLAN